MVGWEPIPEPSLKRIRILSDALLHLEKLQNVFSQHPFSTHQRTNLSLLLEVVDNTLIEAPLRLVVTEKKAAPLQDRLTR